MKAKFISVLFTIVGILVLSSNLYAASGSMGGQPCGGPFPPCPVPLDGGISLLLIAGAAYGGKKLYDSTKQNHR